MQAPVQVRHQHTEQCKRQHLLNKRPVGCGTAAAIHSPLDPAYGEQHAAESHRHANATVEAPRRKERTGERYHYCRYHVQLSPHQPQHKQVAGKVPHIGMANHVHRMIHDRAVCCDIVAAVITHRLTQCPPYHHHNGQHRLHGITPFHCTSLSSASCAHGISVPCASSICRTSVPAA